MKFIILPLLLSTSFAHAFKVCGEDSRQRAMDSKVGRLTLGRKGYCTVTMIGQKCAISAGHCLPLVSGKVEFDVPLSGIFGINNASSRNSYEIDGTVLSGNRGGGLDWMVLKLKANAQTHSFPGDVQGFYPVSFDPAAKGDSIRISGYGDDSRSRSLTGALKTAQGSLVDVVEKYVNISAGDSYDMVKATIALHDVDTESGDSGAALMRIQDDAIIGVHTHGDSCKNQGTLVSANEEFAKAIRSCLNE
jgi:V8-like Glu-specific endopeptidase